MDKIDHATATLDQEFTEGNPQTAVKPTVVTAKWLNGIQNELANFIQSRGITLDAEDETQLIQALDLLNESANLSFSILNDQTNTLMGAAFEFDISKIKSVVISCDIYRKDNIQEKSGVGEITLIVKPLAQTAVVIDTIRGDVDDLGMVFDVDVVTVGPNKIAKLKYSSSDYIGSNYEGTLIYKVTKFLL